MTIPVATAEAATSGAAKARPQTIGDALVVEMLDELAQLRQGIAELPGQLDGALEPTRSQLEGLTLELQRQTRELVEAAHTHRATAVAPTSRPPLSPTATPLPARIPSRGESKRRFSLAEVLLAAGIGLLAGLLIAATVNLRIPGLSG